MINIGNFAISKQNPCSIQQPWEDRSLTRVYLTPKHTCSGTLHQGCPPRGQVHIIYSVHVPTHPKAKLHAISLPAPPPLLSADLSNLTCFRNPRSGHFFFFFFFGNDGPAATVCGSWGGGRGGEGWWKKGRERKGGERGRERKEEGDGDGEGERWWVASPILLSLFPSRLFSLPALSSPAEVSEYRTRRMQGLSILTRTKSHFFEPRKFTYSTSATKQRA